MTLRQSSADGVLYPNQYVWFVLVSALDVMLTWVILWMGGSEVNHWARIVIGRWGLRGLVIFKFTLVIFIIFLCEAVGKRRPITGRRLATTAIGITCLPVVISLILLAFHE